jgi:hypothetical protein
VSPSPWAGLVLALAAYRLTRLLAWDDWPPIVRVRDRLLGAQIKSGNTPYREFRRPLLVELFRCAFCLGWWVSLATYLAWLLEGSWTLYGAFPLALSGAVGLIAKNLDA